MSHFELPHISTTGMTISPLELLLDALPPELDDDELLEGLFAPLELLLLEAGSICPPAPPLPEDPALELDGFVEGGSYAHEAKTTTTAPKNR